MAQSKVSEITSPSIQRVEAGAAQFSMAAIGEGACSLSSYNRRDFFKISFVEKGCSELLYANRNIDITSPAIIFTNPQVPYSWEGVGDINDWAGHFCVFTDEFLLSGSRMESLHQSSLFKPGGDPVYLLDEARVSYIGSIFRRMRQEFDSEYIYKYELIRSQVNLIIHEAIKMQPAVAYFEPQNAASRIVKLFLDLLERQFPVDSPQFVLSLKKASDYADRLAVHVNHLNAAVQEVTGKSTTAHIQETVLNEAKSLLKHTDWSVADIAYSLGFEYPSYFNNFFKKQVGLTPMQVRNDKH